MKRAFFFDLTEMAQKYFLPQKRQYKLKKILAQISSSPLMNFPRIISISKNSKNPSTELTAGKNAQLKHIVQRSIIKLCMQLCMEVLIAIYDVKAIGF